MRAQNNIKAGDVLWAIRHDRTRQGGGLKWYFLFVWHDEDVIDVTEEVARTLGFALKLRRHRGGRSLRTAMIVRGMIEDHVGELSKRLFGSKDELLVKYAVLDQRPWSRLRITGGEGRGGDSRNIQTEKRRTKND